MSHNLACTNEILGAVSIGGMDSASVAELRQDPHGYLAAHADAVVSDDVAIHFVDNSADAVNLALPYYPALDAARVSSMRMDDEDLEDISGGEIIGSVIVLILGVAVIATGISVAAGAGVQGQKGLHLDGRPK